MTITNAATLEQYFEPFRKHVIGNDSTFVSPYGVKHIIYADWTASGRMYVPIEERMMREVLPYVANTHSKTTATGMAMTKAYQDARDIVKRHVNAAEDDILMFCGSGMTAAVMKLQRLLGLRIPERVVEYSTKAVQKEEGGTDNNCSMQPVLNKHLELDDALRPVVFCTQMEHHSNHTTWLETIADVEIIGVGNDGNIDLSHLQRLLEQYQYKKNKIAAVTGCSNVTGIQTPYYDIARIMHEHGGLCFVDFACSAPYITIDMHPAGAGNEQCYLDAIFFSPHKFLGGPGTPGVLIFNAALYRNRVPDQSGGGTVLFTNPWNVVEYFHNIETREDGGTPPFLQAIKTAMAIKLKEEMGVENMLAREEELLAVIFPRLEKIPNLHVLEARNKHRLGVISFTIDDMHHNLVVKILNDRFGIQTRSGWSCSGSYGHYLLDINEEHSSKMLDEIRGGNKYIKPGWVRFSIHPTMTNDEVEYILHAIEQTALHSLEWSKDYDYNPDTNEFKYGDFARPEDAIVEDWFSKPFTI